MIIKSQIGTMKRKSISGKSECKSLITIINGLKKAGYRSQFKSTVIGLLSLSSMNLFKSNEIKKVRFYSFKGDSDTSNCSIYAIETKEGEKGTLLDECGASGNAVITKFMSGVVNLIK